jgi:hypothetical protein
VRTDGNAVYLLNAGAYHRVGRKYGRAVPVTALLSDNLKKHRAVGWRDGQAVAADGSANTLPVWVDQIGRRLHLIRGNAARPAQQQAIGLGQNC